MAVVLAAGLSAVAGCGTSDKGGGSGFPFQAAGAAGAAVVVGGAGASGSGPINGGAGAAPMGMAGSGAGGASSAGAAGAAPTAGAGGGTVGGAGAAAIGDITKVVPTAGCNMDPTGFTPGTTVKFNIQTTGTKDAVCADSNCAPWSYNREYFVTLPANYDKTKAYPLVLEGPGCGSGGQAVYELKPPGGAANADNTVIRVGLTPPPNAIGHATNPASGPGTGCFDDKEGDDSVDWVFYENLYDKLAGQLCFDRNRVFSTGNSSGAWFSNEVGCKYAGDAKRPIRGIMPNTGGLPTDVRYAPTCTNKPMAGMWVGETNDPENAFSGNIVAINRAIKVNGCTGGDWGVTPTVNYPIGGGRPDDVCKRITGCPTLYPLVVCLITGNAHAGHDDTCNPGFTTFLKYFEQAPQLTQ